MTEKLSGEITQLKKALARLNETLGMEPTQVNKDATIQRFEFTFELLWKTLKTFLEESGLIIKNPKDVFRAAADSEIIPSPEPYFKFLTARNLSTHVYSESEADAVYEVIRDFPQAVEKILTYIQSV